eukprot:COSAG05_NODE_13772_length_418_cov_1.137931_1_plen_70_part_10
MLARYHVDRHQDFDAALMNISAAVDMGLERSKPALFKVKTLTAREAFAAGWDFWLAEAWEPALERFKAAM